ncbi:hypothetical protein, partial [Faecalibaculum rodentium]|uniref:hypothetical protein n=1 Tax=Faecalibaculum rodentium TaxID=1702221 RepID=UPI00263AA98F
MINFRIFSLQLLEPGSKSVVFGFEVVVLGFESINLLDTCIPLRLHLVVFTLHLRIRPDDLGFIAVIQLIYGVGCCWNSLLLQVSNLLLRIDGLSENMTEAPNGSVSRFIPVISDSEHLDPYKTIHDMTQILSC